MPYADARARSAVEARGGAVQLVKVDTDANQNLAAQFGVRGIPNVKAFVGGRVADQFTGVIPRARTDRFLDDLDPRARADRSRRLG